MPPAEQEEQDRQRGGPRLLWPLLADSATPPPAAYMQQGPSSPPPPPLLQHLFPHKTDPALTASTKLLNLCAGAAAVLATARGLMAAALAPRGASRAAAFRGGFALTFPIYLPAFCLGAAADHALRRRSEDGGDGHRRRFGGEYDLP